MMTLAPVMEKHPEYEQAALLERFVEPERGRNVCIRSDMAIKFRHKTLTETHNFSIGFTFGIKLQVTDWYISPKKR